MKRDADYFEDIEPELIFVAKRLATPSASSRC